MIKIFWIYFLLLFPVFGQEVLIQEPKKVEASQRQKGNSSHLRTASDTLLLPFREHFLQTSYEVSTKKWIAPNVKVAFKGACLPDYGFAILDGSDSLNLPFVGLQQAYGRSDSLTSQCIDLSAYSPADSLYLSFFVQNGGSFEAAEAQDSLILEAKADSVFIEIWSAVGNDIPRTKAMQVHLPLTDSAFFTSCFQFQFLRAASLNGRYDNFLLDAIYLDKNRTFNDTLQTTAFQSFIGSPFQNGYNLPLKHQAIDTLFPLKCTFFNNFPAGNNLSLDVRISETLNNQFSTNNTFNLNIDTTCSDTQNVGSVLSVSITQNARFSYDFISGGDTFNIFFGIDSVWAYDDGTAETGYGVLEATSFGQSYTLLQPDTLKAVRISFFPGTYKFNLKAFVLEIWRQDANGNIDTLLYSQNIRLQTGKAPDFFYRYYLDSLLPLPNKFLVAIRQYDNNPAGVGMDLDTDNSDKIFYRKNGVWKKTAFSGTLLIRPEFLGGSSSMILTNIPRSADNILKIFPNPATEKIYIRVPRTTPNETIRFSLFSPTGRLILQGSGDEIHIADLAKGLYILKIYFKESLYIKKIIKL